MLSFVRFLLVIGFFCRGVAKCRVWRGVAKCRVWRGIATCRVWRGIATCRVWRGVATCRVWRGIATSYAVILRIHSISYIIYMLFGYGEVYDFV